MLVQAADNPEPYDSAVESMSYDELKEKDELLKEKEELEAEQENTQSPSQNKSIENRLSEIANELSAVQKAIAALVGIGAISAITDDDEYVDVLAPVITLNGLPNLIIEPWLNLYRCRSNC